MEIPIESFSASLQGKLFAFSDTHGVHRRIAVPVYADIAVFAGDACNEGDREQFADFLEWFAALPAKHRLFVAGNHDLPFERDPETARTLVSGGITVLDCGGMTLEGIRFYALPARPWLHSPLYLPSTVDVLVTHGAPAGIMDDRGLGCPVLRRLVDLAAPAIHIFGHVHFCGGQTVRNEKTAFYNVAVTV
jgi:predicted phosphodiesterase